MSTKSFTPGFSLMYSFGSPRFESREAQLEYELKVTRERLEAMQEQPAVQAAVLDVDNKTVTICTGPQSITVRRPSAMGMDIGDIVDIRAGDPPCIVRVREKLISTGPVCTVKQVIEEGCAEVSVGPNTITVYYSKKLEVEAGHRVILDGTNHVIVRNLGKGDRSRFYTEDTGVSWDDIGGLEEAKKLLIEAIEEPITKKELYKKYNRQPVKGILLHGSPGCGKTLLGRACATSLAKMHGSSAKNGGFIYVKGPDILNMFVGNCHATDTEFLTEHGMKYFDDIGPNVRLATFNMETGLLEYQFPTQRHEYEYDGKMCLIRGRGLLVTPNHRMVIQKPTGDGTFTNWYFAEAKDAFTLSNVRIPVAPTKIDDDELPEFITIPAQEVHHGNGDAVTLPSIDLLELLAYFVADGSTNSQGRRGLVRITQQDGLLAERMLELLGKFGKANAHGCDNRSEPPVRQLSVQSIPLWCYLRESCGVGAENKRFPKWVLRLNRQHLGVIWKALMDTDGSRDYRGYPSMSYCTVSQILSEQVQEIAFRLGMRVTIRKVLREGTKQQYIVSTTPKDFFQPSQIDWIKYQGRVVCFSVPNGTLVTRREGRWSISGNSEANIRALFSAAREHKEAHGYPAIVFIDEADAIMGKRGMRMHEGMERTIVPMFLAEMDGLEEAGCMVLLATNRPDVLDPAIVRPKRVDRKIHVRRPNREESENIFKIYLKKVPIGEDIDVLVKASTENLFSDRNGIYIIRTKDGKDRRFGLADLVSGALIDTIVAGASQIALRREIQGSGPEGLIQGDVLQAIKDELSNARELDHTTELQAIVQDERLSLDGIEKIK